MSKLEEQAGHATLPCPSWCEQPAGHAYDMVQFNGMRSRFHDRRTLSLHEPSAYGEHTMVEVRVGLQLLERVDAEGQVAGGHQVEVYLDTNDAPLSASPARKVAAALLNAAEEWDELNT